MVAYVQTIELLDLQGASLVLLSKKLDNFFLFEFWRAEKIILILSLRTFFRTISGQLIFSEYLHSVFIVWNLEKI